MAVGDLACRGESVLGEVLARRVEMNGEREEQSVRRLIERPRECERFDWQWTSRE